MRVVYSEIQVKNIFYNIQLSYFDTHTPMVNDGLL